MEKETGPTKKRPSYRVQRRNSDTRHVPGGSSTGSGGEGAVFWRQQAPEESAMDVVRLVQRPLPPPPPPPVQDDTDVITLSSDDEMEVQNNEQDSCEEEEMILPDIKIEEVDEPQGVVGNGGPAFQGSEAEAQRKSLRRHSPSKRHPFLSFKPTTVTVPIIVNEYSLQRQGAASTSGENQHICNYCGGKMKNKRSLQDHIRKQHISRNPKAVVMFKCRTCGKEVKTEHMLNIHQVTHTTERLFGCEICEKKYKSQFYLDNHLKSKDHKVAEELHMFRQNDETLSQSEQSTLILETSDLMSPPPPTLSLQVSPEKVAQLMSRNLSVAGNSRSGTFSKGSTSSSVGKTTGNATKVMPSASTATASSQIQSSSTPPPQSIMDNSTAIASNGYTNSSMMPPTPMQGMATPVMFYGLMVQPNGASFSGNPFPPAIQPTQYPLSPGMSNFMPAMAPQNMQQVQYQMNPQVFSGPPQQSTPTLFTCSECQAKFSVEAHLRSHMKDVHLNECWKCPKCSKVMLFPEEFQPHYSQCK